MTTVNVVFYGFEILDLDKMIQLQAAEDHAGAMWKTRCIEDEPYVPDECEFFNGHKCPPELLKMWNAELECIHDKKCRLIRFGNVSKYSTSRVALAIRVTVIESDFKKDSDDTKIFMKLKTTWPKYLKEFAKNLGTVYNKPKWFDEDVLS